MVTGTQININMAGKDELDMFLGVDPDLAEEIINYRELYGPFKSWDDLMNVEGVTDSVVKMMRESGATL